MAELLLELFSEEIPARMQARAAEDLRRLVTDGLKAQGLAAGEAKAYATPRRLTLVVEGVPAKSPDLSEERKGPRVNAPEQAIAGFVKSAGLKSIKDATVVKDEKKGDFYVVKIEKPGGPQGGQIISRGRAGGLPQAFPGRSRCGSTAGTRLRRDDSKSRNSMNCGGCGRCIRSFACWMARSCPSTSERWRAETKPAAIAFSATNCSTCRERPTTSRPSRRTKSSSIRRSARR